MYWFSTCAFLNRLKQFGASLFYQILVCRQRLQFIGYRLRRIAEFWNSTTRTHMRQCDTVFLYYKIFKQSLLVIRPVDIRLLTTGKRKLFFKLKLFSFV